MASHGQSTQPPRTFEIAGPFPAADSTDRWLTDRIVTITVGPDEKRWTVHEKLLSSQSEFFNAYFNGTEGANGADGIDGADGADGADGTDNPADREEMKLPDDDPKLFALFIRWLYGTAFATSGGSRVFRFTVPDGVDVTVRDYLALYVMGGKFGMIGLRNAAIDALYTYYGEVSENHESPNLHDIKYIFANTTPDAPIRRFLIVHTLFFLFCKGRQNRPLPEDWADVLREEGEIGYSMIRMLSEWNWVMGVGTPPMKVKARSEFHERMPQPLIVKEEPEESIEV